MDTPSLLARNVLDIIAMYECLSGFDHRDPQSNRYKSENGFLLNKLFDIKSFESSNKNSNSVQCTINDIQSLLLKSKDEISLHGLTIGIPVEYNISDMSDVIREAWLEAIG